METTRSQELMAEAVRFIPGGVDSPVRAFRAVGGQPLFIRRASGCRIFDEDGNEFIDYLGSWGPLVLGHAHPEVVRAVQDAAAEGTSFGAPTWREVELARMVVEAVPSVEMVRFVNSGTEATMSAIRLARAWTNRDRIIKFDGCYHGHADGLLVKAGSGATTLGVPDSPGVPSAFAGLTISARYNDLESVEAALRLFPDSVAAIVVEPVAGNMGVVPPAPGFLAGLRELATRYRVLLIFDEVITGFRLALGGAQELYGVLPDLTCFGKIIGGGLPVGAYGGRRQIMEMVSPSGPVYQAGTLSGNPLAMAAGMATLLCLGRPGVYAELEQKAARLERGLREAAEAAGVPMVVNRVGSMLTGFFTERAVVDYESAMASDTRRYAAFFRGMLQRGVYLAPSQFEAAFVSIAHTDEDLDLTVRAAAEVLRTMASSGADRGDTGWDGQSAST